MRGAEIGMSSETVFLINLKDSHPYRLRGDSQDREASLLFLLNQFKEIDNQKPLLNSLNIFISYEAGIDFKNFKRSSKLKSPLRFIDRLNLEICKSTIIAHAP